MKKLFLTVIAVINLASYASAYEFPGFEWEVGADFTSAYLWRGMNYGGLAFQPDASVGYGGLKAEAWFNLSPEDYTFKAFAPEMDITLSYTIYGFTVGVNHLYYFDGSKYFDYRKPALKDWENGDYSTSQTEVFASFNFGDIWENVPLRIFWGTYVGGDDWCPLYEDPADEDKVTGIKQAYSSYLEFSFDAELPLGFTLTPTIGLTPWKSTYTYYEGNFALNNISLKLNWEYEVSDHFGIDVYAIGMLNTYGVNSKNVWASTDNTYSNDITSRHLNGAIGLGLWFY